MNGGRGGVSDAAAVGAGGRDVYRRTQSSYSSLPVVVVVLVLLVVVAAFLRSAGESAAAWVVVAVVVVVFAVAVVFSQLTVTVDDHELVVAFRWGWPRRRIDLADVSGATVVRNRWWYGWGLRKVPGGWMYNVAGLDAVEVELRTGRRFRVGTDDPHRLLAAITSCR